MHAHVFQWKTKAKNRSYLYTPYAYMYTDI